MIRTQRQHQRQRWIALWAILALLLGQNASAAHACMRSPLAAASTAEQTHTGHSADHVSVTKACPHCSTVATSACMVHCADHAKDSSPSAKVFEVPMLPGLGFWPLLVRLESTPTTRVGQVDVIRNADNRRLYEFCTLLI
ncbi:MAG: hypothetical protein CVV12_02715 [Gammaproteobacteria bacterium HGW-Gammaproteobacteria-2]|nr:MAG: hypothetical protein CVV12_02715 [Gammaproteobacteria bacterium HGW-Gammaproteobacteria-2]